MLLFYSATSPFARKIRIALLEKGVVHTLRTDDVLGPASAVPAFNPLGKVPTLVLEPGDPHAHALALDARAAPRGGVGLYDSPVILRYLDAIAPEPPLLCGGVAGQLAALRWEALCDGVCDAAVTVVLERRRPVERQDPASIDRQLIKIERGLRALQGWTSTALARGGSAATLRSLVPEAGQLADVSLCCALGYLDLRLPELWRARGYDALEAFEGAVATRPSVRDTAPPR